VHCVPRERARENSAINFPVSKFQAKQAFINTSMMSGLLGKFLLRNSYHVLTEGKWMKMGYGTIFTVTTTL
jgi:hypothetical protein